jgi:RNA polymerase sigma factor (sigma-70 family)
MILEVDHKRKANEPSPTPNPGSASYSQKPVAAASDHDGPPIPQGPLRYFYHPDFRDESISHLILGPMPKGEHKSARPPQGLPSYLARLWTIPLLNRHQEQHCFRKLNYLKYLANVEINANDQSGRPVDRSDEIRSLEASVFRARNFIVEANLRLVVSLARKYAATTTVEFDELVSVGNDVLIRATDLFDFRRGLRFSTYAYQAVQRSIFNAIKGSVGRRIIDNAEGEEAMESVVGDAAESLWSEKHAEQARGLVETLLEKLDHRDRRIVMSRFGIDSDHDGASFRTIANKIGLSSTRTAQLFHRSMDQLREALENEGAIVDDV